MSHQSESKTGATRQEEEQEQEEDQERIQNPSTQNTRNNHAGAESAEAADCDSILEIMAKRSRYEARQRDHDSLGNEAGGEENIAEAGTGILETDALPSQQDVARIPPNMVDRNRRVDDSTTSSCNHQIMKLVAERSRCGSSLLGSVEHLPLAATPVPESRWEDPSVLESIQPLPTPTPNPGPETNPENYSRNHKKRVAGPIQPGAFGATPGEQPLRVQSLRYSAFNHPTPVLGPAIDTGGGEYGCPLGNDLNDGSDSRHPQPNSGGITEADEESPLQEAPKQNEGLVEAKAVQSSQKTIVEANAVDPAVEEAKQQRRTGLLYGSLAGLCLAASGVVMTVLYMAGVFNSSYSKPAASVPSSSISLVPSQAPTQRFLVLPDYTLEAIEDSPDSPQARAYHWLENDPMLDTYSSSRLLQRYALAVFYYATGGDQWILNIDWLSYENHECVWYHKRHDNQTIACDMEKNLLGLELTNNGLAGTLPLEMSLLTNLEILDVADNNNICGPIPTEVGLMTSLRELIVDMNEISGSIPTVIGQLSWLERLYIHSNPITGTIPTQVGQLTQMMDLELGISPMMTGTLPSELGLLTKMTYLHAASSSFEGTIPREIWNLPALLEGVALSHNLLNGTIPTQLGLLSTSEVIQLHFNSFSGAIPSEVGNLKAVKDFILYNNSFSGGIPSEMGNLQRTTMLHLSTNKLTGTIPSQVFRLTKLKELWLDTNSLSGTISQHVGKLVNTVIIAMGQNQLQGTIPTQFGYLSMLEILDLGGNNLSGTLPSQLGLMSNLQALSLVENFLSGTLPPELFHQHQMGDRSPPLAILGVSSNNLTGTIPTEIVDLSSLVYFHLHDTFVHSTVPPSVCDLKELLFNCSDLLCGCDCNCSN